MADIYGQVILKTADAIPANYVTNTLSFDMTNSGTNFDAVTLNIKDFYDAIASQLFPSTIERDGHIIKWYLHGGPQPNYPQAETGFNLAAVPAGDPYPPEVALCLSFQATRIPGQEQRRKQGRIYLGHCKETAGSGNRPSTTTRSTIATAAADFLTDVGTDSDGFWAVYSGSNGSSTEVNNGWVDDVWDTQRRRGLETTSKTLWP